MLPITEKITSHYNPDLGKEIPLTIGGKRISFRRRGDLPKGIDIVSVAQIRESVGYEVKQFRKLVRFVAELASYNPQYNLLYRGQQNDYKDKNGRSKVYPTIYRPEASGTIVRNTHIENRYERLKTLRRLLIKNQKKISKYRKLMSYPEYYYALLQHYEITSTPLIDLTQSLRVAASFALDSSKTGYVLVFGIPYPQGSISHFVDAEMVLVKLQSVCPAKALRPHYQEGFLVGKLPFNTRKEAGDNLAKRLIGKYRLVNSNGKFWDRGFTKIPEEALRPKRDLFHQQLLALTNKISKLGTSK